MFHCLVMRFNNKQRSNHRKPKPITLCASLRIIPEHYNRFVDHFNCKFECTVAEHSKGKFSSIDNFEISNNVGSIKLEFCKIEIRL